MCREEGYDPSQRPLYDEEDEDEDVEGPAPAPAEEEEATADDPVNGAGRRWSPAGAWWPASSILRYPLFILTLCLTQLFILVEGVTVIWGYLTLLA